MGLDISAYKKAKFIRVLAPGEDSDVEWPRLRYLYVNPDFPDRADGMVDGLYDVGGDTRFGDEADRNGDHQLHFRAGSYSGYNQWRRHLAKLTLDAVDREIWDNPELFKGKPFYELINFADNEGILGPKTCARLAASFQAYGASIRQRAAAVLGVDTEWFLDRFAKWQKAFELAADTGCVQFH